MKCRHCQTEVSLPLIDLGAAPPSNAYLTESDLHKPEKYFPLRVLVCTQCWLVQTEDYVDAHEFFSADYAYFSSFSNLWLSHAKQYVRDMITRFGLNAHSHIIEIAANDGYLLQFAKAQGIPCLGIEPTASTAKVARAKGIEIIEAFFDKTLALQLVEQGRAADLIVANNVLAHVPDINNFVSGFARLLKPAGVATFEFPHLLHLVSGNQFDTIYHEHFSYLSFTTVQRIFAQNGLSIFDVDELTTHGGSLRVFAQATKTGKQCITDKVARLLARELSLGMQATAFYTGFQSKAVQLKNEFLSFLLDVNRRKKTITGYGAAAKGNTLLNFAGVKPDLLPFICDAASSKQNKFMPGSRIPIVSPQKLKELKPDFVLIFPWNIADEVINDHHYVYSWGGKFVTAVPGLVIK